MAEYSRADIRGSFDTLTAATLGGTNPIPVIYGNVENVALSEGVEPYVSQRVIFMQDTQFELGCQNRRRIHGYVSFLIHTRYNTGDLVRDGLIDRLTRAFRSTYVGGAITSDPRVINTMRVENWAVTALQIPFYYETYEVI